MLYLPRLFIYHCDAPKGSVQSETFKVMERRLLTIIINPAMIVAWVLGLWLAWKAGYFKDAWFHGKACGGDRALGGARLFLDGRQGVRRRPQRQAGAALGESSTRSRPF